MGRSNSGMEDVPLGEISLERMVRAVEKARERLLRATAALEKAGVPYAVGGGNAVAAWVARVDEAAVRNTPDVELLLRRPDLDGAALVLEAAGFVRRDTNGTCLLLDGAQGTTRDAVRLLVAGEKGRPEDALPAPDVADSEPIGAFRVLSLAALVQMELACFRRLNRLHLRDLLDVGLLDAAWRDRLPAELAARLQELLDTPDG
jgi:hypothetical protein